jgi:hypothetical protein
VGVVLNGSDRPEALLEQAAWIGSGLVSIQEWASKKLGPHLPFRTIVPGWHHAATQNFCADATFLDWLGWVRVDLYIYDISKYT